MSRWEMYQITLRSTSLTYIAFRHNAFENNYCKKSRQTIAFEVI